MYDKQGLRLLLDGLGPGYALEANSLRSPLEIFIGDAAAAGVADAELALEKSTASQGLLAVQPNEPDLYGYVDENLDAVQAFTNNRPRAARLGLRPRDRAADDGCVSVGRRRPHDRPDRSGHGQARSRRTCRRSNKAAVARNCSARQALTVADHPLFATLYTARALRRFKTGSDSGRRAVSAARCRDSCAVGTERAGLAFRDHSRRGGEAADAAVVANAVATLHRALRGSTRSDRRTAAFAAAVAAQRGTPRASPRRMSRDHRSARFERPPRHARRQRVSGGAESAACRARARSRRFGVQLSRCRTKRNCARCCAFPTTIRSIACCRSVIRPTDKVRCGVSPSATSRISTRSEREWPFAKEQPAEGWQRGGSTATDANEIMRGRDLNVVVWGENVHERKNPGGGAIYPDGMHTTIARLLAKGLPGNEIATATLEQPRTRPRRRAARRDRRAVVVGPPRASQGRRRSRRSASRSACSTAWG